MALRLHSCTSYWTSIHTYFLALLLSLSFSNCNRTFHLLAWIQPPYFIGENDGIIPMLLDNTKDFCGGINVQFVVKPLSGLDAMVDVFTAADIPTALESYGFQNLSNIVLAPMTPSAKFQIKNPAINNRVAILDTKGVVSIKRTKDVMLAMKIIGAILRSLPLVWILLLMAGCAAVIIWLVERWGQKPTVHPRFTQGVWESMWWSVVSMSTVGYGDIVPRTWIGRFIATIWIILSLLVVACITSVITGGVTGNEHDLRNRTVAVVGNTWEHMIAKQLTLHTFTSGSDDSTIREFKTYDECLDAVDKDSSISAALIDYNVAAYLQRDINVRDLRVTHVYQSPYVLNIGFYLTPNNSEFVLPVIKCLQSMPSEVTKRIHDINIPPLHTTPVELDILRSATKAIIVWSSCLIGCVLVGCAVDLLMKWRGRSSFRDICNARKTSSSMEYDVTTLDSYKNKVSTMKQHLLQDVDDIRKLKISIIKQLEDLELAMGNRTDKETNFNGK